ncbi:MAG TPA: DegQ family serine endoprotease [Myxococcota bacterium]|nr:DegQ family serine endoprotease [Myxococcota bacterium]HRY95532.1 DegQ family serine endoprotease [Myxococcota bacterium]HSA19934.1 DegQ family serine endoprotease [Myxococcota bacterium]
MRKCGVSGTLGWVAVGVLVAGGLVAAFTSEGRAGTPGPAGGLWQERPGASAPVLERGASPLASLAPLVKQLQPAVVNIYTTQVVKPRVMRRGQMPRGLDPFFEEFFGGGDPFGLQQSPGRELKRDSLGSGFIISADGYLLTNHHVVADASEIRVRLEDDHTYVAKVIGSDPKTDLALLKIEPKRPLPFVFLGDSDKLEVGDWVIAIGNPFGLGRTVTAGIISGKGRVLGHGPYDDFLQTDASINPGNSGGPLFDAAGNVIGINTAIIAGGSGVGFAVPVNLAKDLLPQLRSAGKVTRGWLGVGIQDLSEELAEKFGVEPESGVLLGQVFEGGPADKAGLRAGDIVLRLDGRQVREARQLTSRVATYAPGAKVELEVLRDGKKLSVQVVLGEREKGEAMALGGEGGEGTAAEAGQALGLQLSPLTPEWARKLGLSEGSRGAVVEEVDPAGPTAGLVRTGDVVLEVNRQRVTGPGDVARVLSRGGAKDSVLLRIQRGNGQLFLVVKR